ncbi:hypothetical protein LSH36_1103g00017 [Paralvinella palmiformis]|uniref:G-protein coupled receptors family 1 profile domain-containing protein n=1 Tax=Paralvinella palmiformis TaxID=53620 RepID=A0AAD9IVN3_9ANNE|nr:hypothetical protein LSH36_1103g00017 [Paralvinella palmiformis]
MDNITNATISFLTAYSIDNSTQLEHAQKIFDIEFPDMTTITIAMTITYAVVFLFGLVGNVLVIFVICRNPDMSTTTNYFLINLSLADLLVLLQSTTSFIISALPLMNPDPYGRMFSWDKVDYVLSSFIISYVHVLENQALWCEVE